MPKIIVLGGYARSGKTTHGLKALAELGVPAVSTSETLHRMAENILIHLCGVSRETAFEIFQNKKLKFLFTVALGVKYIGIEGIGQRLFSRDVLITVAEKIIIPVIGRLNAIIRPTLDGIERSDEDMVVVESIGGCEWELMKKELEARNLSYRCINLRRKSEEPDADYRELLPDAVDIWNDGTFEELKETLSQYVQGYYYNV